MDIKSLLSDPQAPRSVTSNPGTPVHSPFKFVQRTHSGPTGPAKQNGSPLSQSMIPPSVPAYLLSPQQPSVSSPLISPVPTSSNGPQFSRNNSTQSMDTLADLASMQNHQPSRPLTGLFKHRDSFDSQSSETRFNTIASASLTSNPRASFDINMLDTAKQAFRTDFLGTSLSENKQLKLGELAAYVQEVPSAYASHIEIIDILHEGFINYIYPSSRPGARRDPANYELLSELRGARENMEKLFAVGESVWADWLQDESMLAHTAEERIGVVERFRKAVDEEVGSIKLWLSYGDWVLHCYNWANDDQPQNTADEEKLVGREIFTWQLVLDTWQDALSQTKHELAQSHVVWDKYLGIRIPNLQSKLTKDETELCMRLFEQRLQTPHAAWDATFQAFSSFVSSNLPADEYEDIMSIHLRLSNEGKKKWAARQSFESALENAQSTGDRDAEYVAFTQYIEWEQKTEKRRKPETEYVNAIYQRAELRFPSDTALWEEHAVCLIESSAPGVLTLLERATKHCPWSGNLWSLSLLTSDRVGQSFQDTEGIKHRATSTGLLEAAGIEEVLKVHIAWCSYLRRRSTRADREEEDIDVAEMGIRSSIESISSLGVKLGLGDTPDPSFRLHRIYITFLSESGRWDNARQEFDSTVRDYGSSWEFWIRFYHWEMMRWRKFSSKAGQEEPFGSTSPPHMATAVLKQALDQSNLDYPEPIIQALLSHCEDYEDAEELQLVMLKARKVQKDLAARRQAEAGRIAAEVASKAQTKDEDDSMLQSTKRKRDFEIEEPDDSHKKSRNGDYAIQSVEQTPSEQPKRDREHATILVGNLPEDITDIKIRQYFSSCGSVRAIKILESGTSATVEFDDDDAAHYALSRDGQDLNGAILSVILDIGSTLYVANYQPAAGEKYIRDLLSPFGEIVNVRFPSLQGNKRRRFCYVQMKLPAEAQAATMDLDGKEIEGLPLVCKISNPAVKKPRLEQNVNDGRTVFVGKLNFKASEDEIKEEFTGFGNIELIRMPRHEHMKARNKGIAFITFSSEREAQAALEMHGQKWKGLNLTVNIANDKANGRRISEANGYADSRTPSRTHASEDRATSSNVSPLSHDDRSQRTVFLLDVPDIVNEDRMRAIVSKYGNALKVILKTNHQGAIIEYSAVNAAGEAALKLEGFEIEAGRRLRVVSEQEMQAHGPERKVEGFVTSQKSKLTKPPTALPATGFIKRPLQVGGKKRATLGQRNDLVRQQPQMQSSEHTPGKDKKALANGNGNDMDVDMITDNSSAGSGKKNNDDFRAMISR